MKQINLLFIAALLTGCGSSDTNPFAVEDESTPVTQPLNDTSQTQPVVAPIVEPEPTPQPEVVTAPVVQPQPTSPQPLQLCSESGVGYGWENGQSCIYEVIETVVTPIVAPVVVEPIVEPVVEPEPIVIRPVDRDYERFLGIQMICNNGPVPAGSRPTDFMRITINEDGTYVTTSIPDRLGERVDVWSYVPGVFYISGAEWAIDGDTITRNESVCVEEVETVVSAVVEVTFQDLIGQPLDCVIYGEQNGLNPHTLFFRNDNTLLRTFPNGNTQSVSWTQEQDTITSAFGVFTVVGDKLTTGNLNGWEYTCAF